MFKTLSLTNFQLTNQSYPNTHSTYPIHSQHIFFLQPAFSLNKAHHFPQVAPFKPAHHFIVILKKLFCLVEQKPVLTLLQLLPALRPLLYLLSQLYAHLPLYVSLVRELYVAQHRCCILVWTGWVWMCIFDETDNIGPQRHIAKLIPLSIRLPKIRLNILQPMQAHHNINHHKLRGRKCQLPGKKLTHNLSRSHPPKLIKLIVTFYYRVTFVQVLLVLCVFEKVYELELLDSVQEKSCVVAVWQLGDCYQPQEWGEVCFWRKYRP